MHLIGCEQANKALYVTLCTIMQLILHNLIYVWYHCKNDAPPPQHHHPPSQSNPHHLGLRILVMSFMSLSIIVTRLAWMAHSCASSVKRTQCASEASYRADETPEP